MDGQMERVGYPWWISPLFGLLAIGFFIPALGGPGPVLSGSLTFPTVLTALTSLAVSLAGMVVAEWWGRRISPPKDLAEATKRGNRRVLFLIVLVVAGGAILRSASESPSVFRAVAFGLFSGLCLGGAVVLPFDKRRRLPFEVPPKERRA